MMEKTSSSDSVSNVEVVVLQPITPIKKIGIGSKYRSMFMDNLSVAGVEVLAVSVA
ncbi:MAG: hypothetical protein JW863_06910 [Chitinispirillaceae bacterium]|nr:hypothetical protein [Chitinispirillaceae bacterium]